MDMYRQCPACGEHFDESDVLIEVDDYAECFNCLQGDPEILSELRQTHPELFHNTELRK